MTTTMVLDAIEQAIWTRQQEGVQSIHVDQVQRAACRGRHPALGRGGRQLL